jgi:ubiquinone biosynthesis monooxygenase Coq7
MNNRQLTSVDRLLSGVDSALRAFSSGPQGSDRPSPAAKAASDRLSVKEKAHAAGLMRVNHSGEVAAQGLYQGHAAVARDPTIEQQMQHAADEEKDHLSWCADRLQELGSRPSILNPAWYAGAYAIGAASGLLGDKWSLGFIAETESQVVKHLSSHLQKLPADDQRSRAIVAAMREDEARHGTNAEQAGAAELPLPIRKLMNLSSKIMTTTAYWL